MQQEKALKLFIPEGLTYKSPFTYFVELIPLKLLYYGCKWADYKGSPCDSSIFMTESGYQTSSVQMKELIKEYGLDAFNVLCIQHYTTGQEAREAEEKHLKNVNARTNPRYINKSNGGTNFYGGPHSEETKQKLSIAAKNRPAITEETKTKISIALTGKPGHPQTEGTIRKISEKQKGVPRVPLSLESCDKISKKLMGRPRPEEVKRKISKTKKNKIAFNNGIKTIFADKLPIGDEWVPGVFLIDKLRELCGNSTRGKLCFNNGVKTIISKEKPEGDEWVPGRHKQKSLTQEEKLQKKANRKKRPICKWYTNGIINKLCENQPEGAEWKPGITKHKLIISDPSLQNS